MSATFQPGRTYQTRSACDHDCIFSVTVTRRTAKSVWFTYRGDEKRAKIHVYSDVETFYPFGQYSMAAIMSADRQNA